MHDETQPTPSPKIRVEHADIIFTGELIATVDNRRDDNPFWASLSLFRVLTHHYILVEEWYIADTYHSHPTSGIEPPPPRTSLHSDLYSVFRTLANADMVTQLHTQAIAHAACQEQST